MVENPKQVGLSGLTRGAERAAAVPRPRSRWLTRLAVPMFVLLGAGSILAYAARDVLLPATPVRVRPVVVREGAGGAGPRPASAASSVAAVVVQAPGWIEPDPFAIGVPALAEGVVREVLALEGQRVEAGQTVARLIDDDALLSVRMAEAVLAERRAEHEESLSAARAEASRAEEIGDEVERKRPLAASNDISAGDFARLVLRHSAQVSQAEAMRAKAQRVESSVAGAEAALAEAHLRLARMEVVAPVSGVVLQRLVEPGSRIMLSGSEAGSGPVGTVMRLYDPDRLQVRVDIPLADAAKVGLGQRAIISTEALPGQELEGEVSRLVHEANIQKNTVQVKVRLKEPAAGLRPEMLVKARLFGEASGVEKERGEPADASASSGPGGTALRVFAPIEALHGAGEERAEAWVVDVEGSLARRRVVRLLGLPGADGWAEVGDGLRPGDRVIVSDSSGLKDGRRVRIVREEASP